VISKAIEFLRNRTFFVSTVENGIPHTRPFGAVMEFENKIYIVTSTTKNVYKQIVKNPNVCLCACDEARNWVRINGLAVLDDRVEAKQKMLDENPVLTKNKRYTGATDPSMAIFYIDKTRVEFHD